MSLSLSYNNVMFGQQDVRPMLPLPMVYENVPEIPTNWEYKVLTVDTREMDLPDVAALNELGDQGWLLTSVLDQRTSHGSTFVHYYFVRQKKA
jgi:hypothetical protein